MIRLDKQVALITDGARGLGLEYARLFVKRSAIVIIQNSGVDKDGSNTQLPTTLYRCQYCCSHMARTCHISHNEKTALWANYS